MGGDSQGTSYCNATNNLFINGPAVGGNAFTGGNSNFNIYADDNWQDKNRDGILNPTAFLSRNIPGHPLFSPNLTITPLACLSGQCIDRQSAPDGGCFVALSRSGGFLCDKRNHVVW